MMRFTGAVLCLFAVLWHGPAFAERRIALVIGNGAYQHAPALANPKYDAEGMSVALKRLGFDVITGVDLDKAGMDRLIEAFDRKLDGADVALFFYAGHGLQVNGRNFLVPVDAKLERESQLNFHAVSIDLVQQLMEQTQRTNVIILDACRDNPLARTLARAMGTRSTGVGNGLAQIQGGSGTLIVYATQPGNVALDGAGRNSPFTQALLEHLETPGLEVRQVLTRVRASVTKATAGKQLPWEATSLTGDFYFKPIAAPTPPPPQPSPPVVDPRPPAPPAASETEVMFWQGIRESRSISDFKAYLERWPNGLFAALARGRIAEFERAAAEEAKRAEVQRRKGADDQRADAERKAREEARRDDERKRGQADVLARLAGQRLDQAKAALNQRRFRDARRLADEASALSREAVALAPSTPTSQGVARELDVFGRDLERRIEQQAATLLREARGFIAQKKFAEAEKRLAEAEGIAPASAAAARRELEAAQGREAAEAAKRAEEESRKKGAEEAKINGPDPKLQAQIANSSYQLERKRGLIAFAHKKTTLEPSAIAALDKLVESLRDVKEYKIDLIAVADRSEGISVELQALSRSRLAAIQQWLVTKGVPAANLRAGTGPTRGEGAGYRVVSISVTAAAIEKRDAAPIGPKPQSGAPAAELARRLAGAAWGGTLNRSVLNWSGQAENFVSIIRFQSSNALEIVAHNASGAWGNSSHIVADDKGTWSVADGRVCISLARSTGGQQQCYTATIDDEGRVTFSGAGILAGKRFSR